jgi:hypothetical protein
VSPLAEPLCGELPLLDDPSTLKAMVIAERAQNERPIRSSKSCSVIALAIDLRTPLVLALLTHSPRQHQRHAEYLLQRRIPLILRTMSRVIRPR